MGDRPPIPGITVGEKGLITIDTTKIANKAMVKAFADITGMQTLAIPDKIDRETYQTLVDLKEGPKREAYLASIKPRLSKASYKAAVQRLDDVIAHAEALASKGGGLSSRTAGPMWKRRPRVRARSM